MENKGISLNIFYNKVKDMFDEFSDKDVFIVDSNVLLLNHDIKNYLKDKNFLEIYSSEKNKNLETVSEIYSFLLKNKKAQKLVGIGGGIVGDIAGYAASTFKRGIPYVSVPTTLIAMSDSAIGGKTGVNFKGVKNYIGTFNTPSKIIFCFEFLETLKKREIKSGIGEIIKYGLIGDKTIINLLCSKTINSISLLDLKKLIIKSIKIKESFVKEDYFDKGVRNALNFGHSIGHGVEMDSLDNLSHGEAICLGMIVELRLSEIKYNLNKDILNNIKTILYNFEIKEKTKIKNIDNLFSLIYKDKKNDEFLRFTLLKNLEEPKVQIKISEKEIALCIKEILE